MDSCCNKIIEGIRQLDADDDGIKSNQKYKYIHGLFQKECTSAKHLRDIYVKLNEQSLKENAFAINFALLGSSRLFQTTEIFGNKTQTLMLNLMKENYQKLDELKDTNINEFYNSLTLFSEFWNRARTEDGGPIVFLVKPLIEYLKILINLNTERSAKEFATHIILNGEKMTKSHPDEVIDLMNLVREQIFSDDIESKSARIWLMFSIEYSYSNFRCVVPKVEKCYNELLKKAHKNKNVVEVTPEPPTEAQDDKQQLKDVEEPKEEEKKVECEIKDEQKLSRNPSEEELQVQKEQTNKVEENLELPVRQNSNDIINNSRKSFRPPIKPYAIQHSTTDKTKENNHKESNGSNDDVDSQKLVTNLCQNIIKSAVATNWSPRDPATGRLSACSHSNGRISPKSNGRWNYNENDSCHNNRTKSPGRMDNKFKVITGNAENFKPKSGGILSPRERLRAHLMKEKSNLKEQIPRNQECNINNDNDKHVQISQNNTQNTYQNNTQKKKTIKSYLKDEYVENLTWNNDDHNDYYPERNDVSPKFFNYLQRN